MLHTRIQDWLWTGMDRTKAGCWVWSPAPSQHPERLPSSVLIHCEEEEEEKEEEAGGHPDGCWYTSGGDDIICQWIFQEAPQESGLAQQRPETQPHLPKVVLEAADEDKQVSQYSDGRCWWEDPGLETQGCTCVYQQREPHGLGSCWPGCPHAHRLTGRLVPTVRRNLLVGVEVVEEVAIEDTVELITDGIYTPDQLYPP